MHILLVEDHPNTVTWLSEIVKEVYGDIELHIASNVEEASKQIEQQSCDIYLLDINLPDGSGLDLIASCIQVNPESVVVMTTIHDDDQHIFSALRAGAKGYILKEESRDSIIEKLLAIKSGDVPLSPSVARRVLKFFNDMKPLSSQKSELNYLTDREKDVLSLVGKGFSRKEISQLLSITPNTTSSYIKSIYRKLGISSRSEATAEASRLGLIDIHK